MAKRLNKGIDIHHPNMVKIVFILTFIAILAFLVVIIKNTSINSDTKARITCSEYAKDKNNLNSCPKPDCKISGNYCVLNTNTNTNTSATTRVNCSNYTLANGNINSCPTSTCKRVGNTCIAKTNTIGSPNKSAKSASSCNVQVFLSDCAVTYTEYFTSESKWLILPHDEKCPNGYRDSTDGQIRNYKMTGTFVPKQDRYTEACGFFKGLLKRTKDSLYPWTCCVDTVAYGIKQTKEWDKICSNVPIFDNNTPPNYMGKLDMKCKPNCDNESLTDKINEYKNKTVLSYVFKKDDSYLSEFPCRANETIGFNDQVLGWCCSKDSNFKK